MLAKLLDRQLGLAASHVLGNRTAVAEFRLGVDLARDPETIENSRKMNAACRAGGRIGVGNGTGNEQGLPEIVDGINFLVWARPIARRRL